VVIPDVLCNAGGVTVSYFEWLKNLQHVRFGRMTKKWEEKQKHFMLNVIDSIAPNKISAEERKEFLQGPTEVCAVLCCAVLCCAVLCCAVLCCAVLCCAVLCCAVLCCVLCCCAACCYVGDGAVCCVLRVASRALDAAWSMSVVDAAQRDIVYSGLEDTMKASTEQIIRVANERGCSYRVAAFVIAIEKIAQVYKDSGFTI
jgi:hypothetical protein